jgi:nucleoside-diphosphate-sugar epimerase
MIGAITRRPTVLLTGGSGVLGRALIDELADDHDLVCLRYRTPLGDKRVREVAGDLARPDLGMGAAERRSVGPLDAVLHCGASTNWRARPERIRATNLAGTGHVLDFARAAGVPVYHVSTAFVARPPATDRPLTGPMAYVQSKIEAEEQVLASDHPAVILRPSVIIGDTADGRVSAFQGIHKVILATFRNELPVLPANDGSLIDCVPQDVVARAIGQLLRTGVVTGAYWLTAGDDANTLDEMVNGTIMAVAEQLGLPVHPPRMIPIEAIDRLLLPLLDDVLPPLVRRQFAAFSELMVMFQNSCALPTSLPEIGADLALSREGLLATFRRTVEYCAIHSGHAAADAFDREAVA